MRLRDAVEKSIRRYHAGQMPEKAIEASEKEFVYTPDYFEKLLEEDIPEDEEGVGETDDA